MKEDNLESDLGLPSISGKEPTFTTSKLAWAGLGRAELCRGLSEARLSRVYFSFGLDD